MVPAAMVRPLRERRRRHGPLAASGEVGSTEGGMLMFMFWLRVADEREVAVSP